MNTIINNFRQSVSHIQQNFHFPIKILTYTYRYWVLTCLAYSSYIHYDYKLHSCLRHIIQSLHILTHTLTHTYLSNYKVSSVIKLYILLLSYVMLCILLSKLHQRTTRCTIPSAFPSFGGYNDEKCFSKLQITRIYTWKLK